MTQSTLAKYTQKYRFLILFIGFAIGWNICQLFWLRRDRFKITSVAEPAKEVESHHRSEINKPVYDYQALMAEHELSLDDDKLQTGFQSQRTDNLDKRLLLSVPFNGFLHPKPVKVNNGLDNTQLGDLKQSDEAFSKEASKENGTRNITVLTWNLQGLFGMELKSRTAAVVSVILNENPDILFFQELIDWSFSNLANSLKKSYYGVRGAKPPYPNYYTGIFYNRRRFKMIKSELTKFGNSVMDRSLLTVELYLRGRQKANFALLTTHLESLPQFEKTRLEQLNQCFEKMEEFPQNYNVIFGGDLNLEEGEVEEGMVPQDIKDVWIESGSPNEAKYGWEIEGNKNAEVEGTGPEQKPRTRYDRLYFKSSKTDPLKLKSFKITGKDRVPGSKYYPSDHWALISTFQIN